MKEYQWWIQLLSASLINAELYFCSSSVWVNRSVFANDASASKIVNLNWAVQVLVCCFQKFGNASKLVPAEIDISHVDDNFEYEYDAPEYTPTDKNKQVKTLPSSSDYSLHIGHAAGIVVLIRKKSAKTISSNAAYTSSRVNSQLKRIKTELTSFPKWKILTKKAHAVIWCSQPEIFVWKLSVSVWTRKKQKFLTSDFDNVLMKQVSLTEARHVFIGPEFWDLGNK